MGCEDLEKEIPVDIQRDLPQSVKGNTGAKPRNMDSKF